MHFAKNNRSCRYESYGLLYELQDHFEYYEIWVSIADILWNYRMFFLHSEVKYFDVL